MQKLCRHAWHMALCLALLMVLTLLPVTALAADSTVDSLEALEAAITAAEPGDTITLNGEIVLTSDLVIPADASITLKGGTDAKITTSGTNTILIQGSLTIENLQVSGTMTAGYAPITLAADGAKLYGENLTVQNDGKSTADGFSTSAQGISITAQKANLAQGVNDVVLELKDSHIYVNSASARGIALAGRDAPIPSGTTITLDNTEILNGDDPMNQWLGGYSRGMDLMNAQDLTVNVLNGSKIAGFQYAINSPRNTSTSGLFVTVADSDVRGWSAFNVWTDSGTFLIQRSTLTGMNGDYNGDKKYSFSAFVINSDIYNNGWGEAENNKIILEDSTVNALTLDNQPVETLMRIDVDSTQVELRGEITFTDSTGGAAGAVFDIGNMEDPVAFMERHEEITQGVTVNTPNGNSLWPVFEVKNTFGDGQVSYGESFTSFIGGVDYDGADANNETVILLRDVDASDFAVNGEEGHGNQYGGWTLDLAGHTLQVEAWEGDKIKIIDSSADGSGDILVDGKSVLVARNGEKCYTSLKAAMDEAADGETVTVATDFATEERIWIQNAREVTLDLNGKTITSTISQQFINLNGDGAKLTVTDSSEDGTGRIVSSGDYIFCNLHGTLEIEKGTVESRGTWIYGGQPWGNTIILVYGSNDPTAENYTNVVLGAEAKLTSIETQADGTSVGAGYGVMVDKYGYGVNVDIYGTLEHTALYINGNLVQTEGAVPMFTLHKGAYVNGIYAAGYAKWLIDGATVISDTGMEIRAGELTVKEGSTITGTAVPTTVEPNGNGSTTLGAGLAIAQHTTKCPIKVTIEGGQFNGYSALYQSNPEKNDEASIDKVEISILGGEFSAINGGTLAVYSENKTGFISGGYYTSDPSAYLAPGKMTLPSDKAGYTFMVGDKAVDTPVEPATAAPVVDMGSGIAPEDVSEVQAAAEGVKDNGVLRAMANTLVEDVTTEQQDAAIAAYQASDLEGAAEADPATVNVYVQTYFEITAVAYDPDEVLSLEITPMYRIVASTETDATALVVSGEEAAGQAPNAVVLADSEVELSNLPATTIRITLPQGFPQENLVVRHTKDGAFVAYHDATVSDGVLTFVNDKGFSTFDVLVDTRYAQAIFEDQTLEFTAINVGDALPEMEASSNQVFDGWTFEGIEGTYTTLTDELLTALSEQYTGTPLVAIPQFHDTTIITPTYSITILDSENGTVQSRQHQVSKGTPVTLIVTPDTGYVLDTLTVTDAMGNRVEVTALDDGRYSFIMPGSAVTVEATFTLDDTPSSTLPFTDVDEDDWFYEAVAYVYDKGMMNGVTTTQFAPKENLNRAMIAQVLFNLEGKPAGADSAFTDVAPTAWYCDAVNWAAANKIVEGYGDGTFGPTDDITREQMAAILYRYAAYKGYDTSVQGDLSLFIDGDKVSAWAVDAMTWAVGTELIGGKGDGILDPTGTATRAEVAQIFMNFCEKIAK
jgi:hypothetical protein